MRHKWAYPAVAALATAGVVVATNFLAPAPADNVAQTPVACPAPSGTPTERAQARTRESILQGLREDREHVKRGYERSRTSPGRNAETREEVTLSFDERLTFDQALSIARRYDIAVSSLQYSLPAGGTYFSGQLPVNGDLREPATKEAVTASYRVQVQENIMATRSQIDAGFGREATKRLLEDLQLQEQTMKKSGLPLIGLKGSAPTGTSTTVQDRERTILAGREDTECGNLPVLMPAEDLQFIADAAVANEERVDQAATPAPAPTKGG
jgi:hypothetical protein